MTLIVASDEEGGRRQGTGVGELGDLIVIGDAWRRLQGQREVARSLGISGDPGKVSQLSEPSHLHPKHGGLCCFCLAPIFPLHGSHWETFVSLLFRQG